MDTPSNTTGGELPDIAALSGDDVLRVMGSSAAGLTNERAAELQGKFGKNLIQAGAKKSPVIAPTSRILWQSCYGRQASLP